MIVLLDADVSESATESESKGEHTQKSKSHGSVSKDVEPANTDN